MNDQSSQDSEGISSPQELRQFLLDQFSEEQAAIDELSNEELEAIAGGDRYGINLDESFSEHEISASASHTAPAAKGVKAWIKKPSNQVAVLGPVVTASAAFTVGVVNKGVLSKN